MLWSLRERKIIIFKSYFHISAHTSKLTHQIYREILNEEKEQQGDRDDAQDITAFLKYIIFSKKSLANRYF